MSWSILPPDVEETILASLSLVELTGIFRTCRSFYAAYQRRLASEQAALYDQAVESFGHARITRIATVIAQYLEKDVPHLDADINESFHIKVCEDGGLVHVFRGVMHIHTRWVHINLLRQLKATPPMFYISLGCPQRGVPHTLLLECQDGSHLFTNVSCNRSNVSITVSAGGNNSLDSLSLLQALLSGGLTRSLRDAGQTMEIRVWQRPPRAEVARGRLTVQHHDIYVFTPEEVKNMIAPLLPFASHYTPIDEVVEGWISIRVR
jgi:hypothetical protein